MTDTADYFANHERARRFPWSLYHRPIEDSLTLFLRRVARSKSNANVLVIGCGLMQELDRAPTKLRFTIADIDERAIDSVQALQDERVVEGIVVRADQTLETIDRRFDAIYAKEVIEHIVDWRPYLTALHHILVPGGRLWLSTPNYGEPWLPLVERTFLEVIARMSGFSRRGLHPSPFSRRTLADAVRDAGFTNVSARVLKRRLALVAEAQRGDA